MSLLRLFFQRKRQEQASCINPMGETLSPLMEGPTPEDFEHRDRKAGSCGSLQQWMKEQVIVRTQSISRTTSMSRITNICGDRQSDVRLLLGVLGAPLAPLPITNDSVPQLSLKDAALETSSAQYIVEQYVAATGASRMRSSLKNAYVMGKVKMLSSEFEIAGKVVKTRNPTKAAESGGFILWQMMPDMWYVEMAVGESKVRAGSDGKLVWRHTPWFGSHAAKGPVRPLRRALQGLDPRSIASMFANAKCVGEKNVTGEDCFILKVTADRSTLSARSDGPAEIIRHVIFGLFSQKTGLLMHMEDSHLTRIQSSSGDVVYWETIMDSSIQDYRCIDGLMIAHAGHSVVTLFRFGEVAMSHTRTRLDEIWNIEEVAFNVPGLSVDCFIPPADITVAPACNAVSEVPPAAGGETGKRMVRSGTSKVAAAAAAPAVLPLAGKQPPPQRTLDNVIWRVEI
eukprot:c17080_g1_i1 orf=918-2282(+)